MQRHSLSRGQAKLIDIAAQKLARLRWLATPLPPTLAGIASDKVVKAASHRGLNRLVGRIHENEAKDADGQPGAINVQGNQGVESLQMNGQRNVRIAERVSGEGITGVKFHVAHARQASKRNAGPESAAAERWLERALQNARHGGLAKRLRAQGEKRERRIAAFVRAVEEFKIPKIRAAAQTEAPRADAAKWKGDLLQSRPFIPGQGGPAGRFVLHCGGHRRRRSRKFVRRWKVMRLASW